MSKDDFEGNLESKYEKFLFLLFSTTKISIQIMERDPKMFGFIIKSFLWYDSGKPQKVGQGIQGM